jgi:sphingomyelin phosphodiesterase acid-like 3
MKNNSPLLKNSLFIFFSCLLFSTFLLNSCDETTDPSCRNGSLNKPSGKFFTISDLHFNPYYDTTLTIKLARTPVQEWKAVFESSAIKNYGAYGADCNFLLMNSAFAEMQKTNSKPDFIVITGDFLGHNFESNFTQYTGITNADSMHLFITKTIQFIALEIQQNFPGIPVYPVIGNNDEFCGDYMSQPNDPFLSMFANTWKPFLDSTKGENTFSQTVPQGGYYAASLPGFPDHIIIGLNTIFFSPKDTSTCQQPDTTAGQTELNWLSQTLAACRKEKNKVWFTCHIPPGADVYSSLKHQDDEKECEKHVKMMWKPQYSEQFLALEEQYSDVIVAGLAGHTHMDDFRLLQDASGKPVSFFHINPSISPIFSNNPGFQLFSYDVASMQLLNYTTYVFQGFQNQTDLSWKAEYDFAKTYHVKQIDAQSLAATWKSIYTDTLVRNNYLDHYSMGSAAAKPTLWEPYWCGIGDISKADFVSCACDKMIKPQ